MSVFLRIFIGLALMVGGSFIVIRTQWFLGFFGPIEWAERKMGGGGSNLLYKLIGILVAFIGIIVATNLWDWFLQATLGNIIPTF